MPTITVNKKIFEQLVGKKVSLELIKERLPMLGTSLEKADEEELVVEIFPNRPDLLSEQGLARAFSSFLGIKKGLVKYSVKKSGEKVIIDKSVKEVRPYTACAIVKSLRIDEEKLREIIQIQEKLHITYGRHRKKAAIGIYPLEKITFPITYRAEKAEKIVFQPLEFPKTINALQMLSQHKAGREYGHLLEGKEKFPFFIDAKKEILSLPPIINSHLMGKITSQTKDVFVECSGFDYPTLSICLNIIVTALAEMGGQIYSVDLIYDKEKKISPNLTPQKMKLDLKYINQRLGLDLKVKEAKELLERMGLDLEKNQVLIPAYRADILHPADLAEDIAIAYGYENFIEEIPQVATIGEEDPLAKFANKVREILVSCGLIEVKNYSLMREEELNQKMGLEQEIIPLKNAQGDYNHLRNSLFPALLKNLAENQHQEYPQNIFEIGRVFHYDLSQETGVRETEKLAVMLCYDQSDFTALKQILEALFSSLGVELKIQESEHSSAIPGRAGDILLKGEKIGMLGELHPQVLTNWNLVMPAVGLELDLELLFEKVR